MGDLSSILLVLISLAAGLSAVMFVAWLVHERTNNAGFIDTVWTFGLAGIGAITALWPLDGGAEGRQWLIACLIIVWALRLGVHLAGRSAHIGDDPRYAELRTQWGADASKQMFVLLQKQALVSIPLALTLYFAAHLAEPLWRTIDVLGVCVFTAGLIGEAIADRQLRAFRFANPGRKAVCDHGLWRWSRHPNYFFEWMMWVGLALLGLSWTPLSWLVVAGPIAIYWLLTSVSGIPPLEQHMLRTRGEPFRRYQQRTSAFFPLPPRGIVQ